MQIEAQTLVDALPLATVLIREDARIEAANEPARALLGQALPGRHYITALRAPALLEAIEQCLRDGLARQCPYLTHQAQQEVSYRVSLAPMSLPAGQAVLLSFEDVTPAMLAGAMRRDFVANVSHELRTPLTAIMGFIETLQGPARDDPAGRVRFLDIMSKEAARMNRLVGDLLSLSRVEANERVRPTGRIDPAKLVRSTLHGFSLLAREAGVQLDHDLPAEPFCITGDEDQIRQVLTNLIENAIKYSGKGAQVCVSLSKPTHDPRLRAQAVMISVQDNGPGLEEHHLPRLTERFYRVDNHRSREMGGTGLGLAIVKHVISRHRGHLRISSRPGEGTLFCVILPIR